MQPWKQRIIDEEIQTCWRNNPSGPQDLGGAIIRRTLQAVRLRMRVSASNALSIIDAMLSEEPTLEEQAREWLLSSGINLRKAHEHLDVTLAAFAKHLKEKV